MGKRIDARDVLDPNGKTKRSFNGRIVARFRRTGPNPWDDYERIPGDGGPIEVMPGIRIQVEPEGTAFRMRRRGEVVAVAWVPTDAEQAQLGGDDDARSLFLDRHIAGFQNKPGIGAAAAIAGKLRS
jgi:hypothetical protein